MCCFACNMNENESWGMQGPVVGLGACAAEVRQRMNVRAVQCKCLEKAGQRLHVLGLVVV